MKKWCSLMLAGLMSMGLCACQGDKGADAETQAFTTADVQVLLEADAFSEELETLDSDLAFSLYHLADYGLERDDLMQSSVLRSAGATCEEVAVLIFAEEAQALDAATALEAYRNDQIESNENYRPQEIPKLEDAVIQVRKESVLFVVPADTDAVQSLLK